MHQPNIHAGITGTYARGEHEIGSSLELTDYDKGKVLFGKSMLRESSSIKTDLYTQVIDEINIDGPLYRKLAEVGFSFGNDILVIERKNIIGRTDNHQEYILKVQGYTIQELPEKIPPNGVILDPKGIPKKIEKVGEPIEIIYAVEMTPRARQVFSQRVQELFGNRE